MKDATRQQRLDDDRANMLNGVPTVCRRLGIGRTLVLDEIGRGRLRSVKIGARRLVPESALHEYVRLLESEAERNGDAP